MIFGYARVSTTEQKNSTQTDVLLNAGAEIVYTDTISGTIKNRPGLDELFMKLRAGDTVMVTKFDRLSRSLVDFLDIVGRLEKSRVDFHSIHDKVDTSTPNGRFMFHLIAAMSEFERDLISQRTKDGLAAARKRGRVGGRPTALTVQQKAEVCRMRDEEGRAISELARLFKVSPNTIRRA